MALSMSDALAQYGPMGDLANSIPELKKIFQQAASEEWDPGKFEAAIQGSNWFRGNNEYARYLATQYATDPASYRQQIKNSGISVDLLIKEMGLVPASAARLDQIAKHFLVNNYDEATQRRWLALNIGIASGEGGHFAGQAAELDEHMRQVATSYGVPITDAYRKTYMARVLRGDYTVEGFESLMRARAKAAFPQFAEQIDSGLTIRDIADPYISTMANTLEIGETELDLSDSWVKKALTQTQADGSRGSMPLWQFERQLKDDPRWDKTKQAREQAFETVAQIGREWGFEA